MTMLIGAVREPLVKGWLGDLVGAVHRSENNCNSSLEARTLMVPRLISRFARRPGYLLLVAWTLALFGCGDSAPRTPTSHAAAENGVSPEELLAKVRSTYTKAKSYSDNATLKQRGVDRTRGTMTEMPFTHLSLLFERPNRYAISYEDAIPSSQGKTKYRVVSDGKRVRSAASQLPDQIHEAIAPRETTIENLIPEPELRSAILLVALENLFPQLALLLTRDAEKPIFPRATRLELLPNEKIDTIECYRLSLTEPEGTRILWIDKEKLVLKRMEIPIEGQREALDPSHQYVSYSVDLDFENVTFDAEFAKSATELDIPEEGRLVRRFISPPPAGPSEHLGRPVKQFTFTATDGSEVSPTILAGKIVVLDFWATDCAPCKENTPALEEAYQQIKDHEDVAFFGVSTDPEGLATPAIEKTLKAWGASFPLLRDLEKNAFYDLNVKATPTLMVFGPDNRLQAMHLGILEDADDLVSKIQKLREGDDLVKLAKQEYTDELKEHVAILAAATLEKSLVDEKPAPAKIAPRQLPDHLKIEELWTSKLAELTKPGDIAVLTTPGSDLQEILVLDGGRAVVRYDAAEHRGRVELPEHDEQANGFIRTAVDVEGNRTFLVSGAGWQQVYLYDKDWKFLFAFPDEPHSGVGDASFFDAESSGAPTVAVGYRGGRGVQAGSLEGQSVWMNHYLDHVLNIATGPIGESKVPSLWCTSTRGTVFEIDAQGKAQREFAVPGHTMVALVPQTTKGAAGNYGLSLSKPAHYELVAFDNKGDVQWHYALPVGDYQSAIPPIQRIDLPSEENCLLVAAPNGSLTFVSTAGKIIDEFDYGKPISGLAAITTDDGPILFVSAGNRLTAWRITADSAP
jgi:thiol-disulfide isomerase/thioredoxin